MCPASLVFNTTLGEMLPTSKASFYKSALSGCFRGMVTWLTNMTFHSHSHIILQPNTGCLLKLSRVEPGQYLDGRPPGKTRLLLEEVLVRPAGRAHPVVCVGHNSPV